MPADQAVLTLWLASALAIVAVDGAVEAYQPPDPAATQPQGKMSQSRPPLSSAPTVESQTLKSMLASSSWPRRAIAALRLERYGCPESSAKLAALLKDEAWQVRAFAVRGLARREAPAGETWFAEESEPRVLRTAMRHGYAIKTERLHRGVRILSKSRDLEDKMIAAELGAASGDDQLREDARDTVKQIILKMDRAEAGALSARLAVLTGQDDLHRPFEWQNWLMKAGRGLTIQPGLAPAPAGEPDALPLLARLDHEQFSGVEAYMAKLNERSIDLAICLDCTASMYGELAAAQGGMDELMSFIGDLVPALRVGLVAYRDRQDEFHTRVFDFTSDIAIARRQLWQLSADGGGDHPEGVFPALKAALTQLSWTSESAKTLIIVGDAPPHPGFGAQCIALAQRAKSEASVTMHAISAEGKDVKHFPEIAAAGGGRCVPLENDDALIGEITGLTLGDRYADEFQDFFRIYLELCR